MLFQHQGFGDLTSSVHRQIEVLHPPKLPENLVEMLLVNVLGQSLNNNLTPTV